MKQLFWKEWHEIRWLPLGAALCMALLTFGIASIQMAFLPTVPTSQGLSLSAITLFGTWILSALLAGCGLFSQEVGNESLIFLDALPVGRKRLWYVKTLTAAGTLLLTLFSCTLTWALAASVAFFGRLSLDSPLWHHPELNAVFPLFVLVACAFFAAAVAVSPFVDRMVSAFVTALLVGFGGWSALGALYDAILYNLPVSAQSAESNGSLVAFFCLASIFVCVVTSYYTFTRGESLRSPKRFLVGSISGLISLTVASLVLVFRIGHLMSVW